MPGFEEEVGEEFVARGKSGSPMIPIVFIRESVILMFRLMASFLS